MSNTTTHKQHLNVRDTQLEMNTRGSVSGANPLAEDFTGKLQEAQSQIEKLQQQQAEVERQKQELQEINAAKDDFLQGQVELHEKLSTAVTAMDREIFATRQELDELEQARVCFADHLEKINQLNPDGWNNESLRQDLTRAISVLDLAEDEYEQAVAHFSGGRSASVFGGGSKPKRVSNASPNDNGFITMLVNGLAFNLPIVLLGIAALVLFYLK
jgi:DNA repair exonuclease SbcCD ATPase subunit